MALIGSKIAATVAFSLLASVGSANAQTRLNWPFSQFAQSALPDYPDVIGEYIQIAGGELDANAYTLRTPAELNQATFLRVRSALDGEFPQKAHAVIVAMPGFSSTPAHWLYLSAQLLHKAHLRQGGCRDGQRAVDCRLEVWVVQRRGAHLADTRGARAAILGDSPEAAVEYYFGPSIMGSDGRFALDGRGKFPLASPKALAGRPGAAWKPLEQGDVPFIADWDFETYARDVDRMLALVQQKTGSRNIFLAGHSQGGSFASLYAGRLRPDGTRGFQHLAGIVMLDDAGAYGTDGYPSAQQADAHRQAIDALRGGRSPVYTDAVGLNLASGPAAGAREIASIRYYARENAASESLFAPRQAGMIVPTSQFPGTTAGTANAFLGQIRLSHLARAGMNFDTSPTRSDSAAYGPLQVNLQEPLVVAVGQSLGLLDFTPRSGTSSQCDAGSLPGMCVPLPSQIDPGRVYGWQEAGGRSAIAREAKVGVGQAAQFMKAYAWTSNRTNIRPVTYAFPVSGPRTVDAREIVTNNWYPSERYDADIRFLGGGSKFTFVHDGVRIDIDKTAIDIPLYYAHRAAPSPAMPSVFPGVRDYTYIGPTGTLQSQVAAGKSPLPSTISSRYYRHTDYVAADDTLGDAADAPPPGEPGSSLVANTLLDWVLARTGTEGARVPTPWQLGVVRSR
ncbi:Alpha/beta hydrolase family protein [Paracidovorax anthurii]|uniref:Alpha/beta hydrolase family protein n=1 Tax=Paracidovorax anthurii TaxID=78229 RepID=A0A328ZG09_9BURK|nr:lysophospholipase [Paracidovorax anthurii]RAR85250.1 hypothetical protein AX018_100628 [Paracidovorax anthurii]